MKIKYLLYGAIAGLGLSACGDMDYHEYKVDGADYISETFSGVYGFMTYIYRDLPSDFGNYSGATLASATDEAVYSHQGNQVESFYNGAWGPSNANSSVWSRCWDGISYCNLVLDKFSGLKFEDYLLDVNYKDEMAKYENFQWECRFMRAFFYFELVSQYGGVPLKTSDLNADEANNLERLTADEIFKFIDDECVAIKDSIIADYSTAYPSLGLTENGRANNLAVLALRARAALYHASPLFNPNNDKQLWHDAAVAAQACIKECRNRGMRLASDYSQLFLSSSYQNADALKEIIFTRRNAASNSFEKYNFPIGMENAGGGNCPTQNLVSAYETKDGSEMDWSNPDYSKLDKRFAATIARNGERWPTDLPTDVLETYYGGSNARPLSYATPTGYYLKKYCNPTTIIGTATSTSAYHTWVIFRLGEMYLDYAEAALNYFGDGYASDSQLTMSAAEALNTVRTRAGLQNLPTGLSLNDFMNRYQNERFVELAFEGHRFFDVRRWKKGPEFFTNINVMEITKDGDDFKYNIVKNPAYITTRQWGGDHLYLFPIPQSEILKSGNLTQNPGWN